jgi:hypothetical protein
LWLWRRSWAISAGHYDLIVPITRPCGTKQPVTSNTRSVVVPGDEM